LTQLLHSDIIVKQHVLGYQIDSILKQMEAKIIRKSIEVVIKARTRNHVTTA
jgi:hypothetical protein